MTAIAPPFWGPRVLRGIPLADYVDHLDKDLLFRFLWGLRPAPGQELETLLATEGHPRLDAHLAYLEEHDLLDPTVIYGYFPANVNGDTVALWEQPDQAPAATLTFPRQNRGVHLCLTDWIGDFLPLQLVTMGSRAAAHTSQLFEQGEYRNYLELHGLTVALAEALATYAHQHIRKELGVSPDQGARFSLGYPACPNLDDRRSVVALLDAEAHGVQLTEEMQLDPEASTDAFVLLDPRAHYFTC